MDRQTGRSDLTAAAAAVQSDAAVMVAVHDGETINNDQKDPSRWETLVLAYKTLGVVFGGLVTSPLYVYPSMPLKSPTEDDYLGIYSIMFWTLSLIGVVKYATIALQADDQGEGGTFALYSLLCRNINIGILSSKNASLNSSHSYVNQSKKPSRLGKFCERSLIARRVLLFIAMLGMCMLIGDGILTPAISVLSAMDGLRAQFSSSSSLHGACLVRLTALVWFAGYYTEAGVGRRSLSNRSHCSIPPAEIWYFTSELPVLSYHGCMDSYHSSRWDIQYHKALSEHI
ncbi:hypothetical protein H5410_019828 [Solanum commersonii]|uniref:K+ potassium transporter integral membrane domain-containing protein n=1 Tax=Solanum commersonii TaxID=4109 RepID=A0A9J5Z6C6_SOLCO|nr:hypothetical protein H5410_019828 [Solanum commersonii]